MADYYKMVLDSRAKRVINEAQNNGLGYTDLMKAASRLGVANDQNVINYALTLREQDKAKRQEQITGNVRTALARQPATDNPENWFAPEQGEMAPAPQKREEFYGALGRQQFSPETSFEEMQANPAFRLAQGQFPGEEDEIAKARLKLQQQEADRKARQGAAEQQTAAVRLRLQDRELAWKYYNAGVNAQKPGFADANKWDAQSLEANNDFAEANKNFEFWNSIKKDIDKQGKDYIGDYDPAVVAANLSSAKILKDAAEVQQKLWTEGAKKIREKSMRLGSAVSKGSKKAFEPPEPTPAPAPRSTALPTKEDIAKEFNID